MSDVEKKANGIEPIKDDELDAVAGGANFDRCPGKQYEAQFPEKACDKCKHFSADRVQGKTWDMTCSYYKRTERRRDIWGILPPPMPYRS